MKKIFILGASGSIGENALSVIDSNKENFELVGISVNSNVEKTNKIIKKHNPKYIYINDKSAIENILKTEDTVICEDEKELSDIFNSSDVDIVISAISGFAGIKSTFHAAKSGKKILLANKESIVAGGSLLMEAVRENNTELVPIDSEHNAIFQCLPESRSTQDVKQIVITASGGPFHGRNIDELNNVEVQDALNHPNWEMGAKITVDSASLMNKGLEVIEAMWLFDISAENIEVVVHRQSIIHSAVRFIDGSIVAQLGYPDMKLPIHYALSFPQRQPSSLKKFDFLDYPNLSFEEPDYKTFKNLSLAFLAANKGGSVPCVLNAANEIVVQAFLEERVSFLKMSDIIENCMEKISASRYFTISTKGQNKYTDVDYEKGDAFIFGPESRGLPKEIRDSHESIFIPMKSEGRSLNLANAVSVIVYEAWKAFNFQ